MKIGAVVMSYGITDYLTALLKSYEWVDRLLVMNYRFNTVIPTKDDTALLTIPFKRAELMQGENIEPHDVRNLGIKTLSDCDYIFTADADEFLTRADQEKAITGMKGFDIGVCPIIDYAFDFSHRFPIRGHKPPIIVTPNARFYEVRCYQGGAKHFDDVFLHHVGYTFAPKDLDWKLNWEKRWEGNTILNLIAQQKEKFELPEEIQNLIYESNEELLSRSGK